MEGTPPAAGMTLPERLRALADITEEGCKKTIASMPAEEMLSTMKMVEDFRRAAGGLDAFDKLLEQCVGKAPFEVEIAEAMKLDRDAADEPPNGPSLDWIAEAGS